MKNKVTAQDFFDTCKKYAKTLNVIDTDLLINKKAWGVSLSFKICRAEIVFYRKSAFPAPKNSVCCRVFINKNNPVFFMLSDIQAEFSENDFRAVYFSKVNMQTLDICIDLIVQVLADYVRKIEESTLTSFDDTLYQNLFDAYRDEYNLKPQDLDFSSIGDPERSDYYYFLNLQHHREKSLVFKFTQTEPYIYLSSGEPEIVLLGFEKMKERPSKYEKKLIEFLKTPAAENFSIYPEKYKSLITKSQKTGYVVASEIDKKLPLYWLVAYLPFAVLFCVFFAVCRAVLASGTIADFLTPWYFGLLLAGLCGMFGGIVARKPIAKLLEGKQADTKIKQDEMINTKGTDMAARIFFASVLVGSLIFAFAMGLSGTRVYHNRFDYLGAFGASKEEYYYKDIKCVYHIDAIYNDFGDRIDRGSYVVYMKDGRFFSFDTVTSEQETQQTVLMLLSPDTEIINVDSDRDLPFDMFE